MGRMKRGMSRGTAPRTALALGLAVAIVAAAAGGAGRTALAAESVPDPAAAGNEPVRIADEVAERIAAPSPYPGAETPGDVVWRHTLHRDGASYIAVRFERFDLSSGDVLTLSDPAGRYRHEYRLRGPFGAGGGFWGLSILGPTMEIELRAAGPGPRAGSLVIDRWAHGYPLDEAGSPTDAPEALCGPEDFQDMECYKDTYPVEYQRARAVVRLIKNGSAHCTGWLASCENHIVTNEHCVSSQSELNTIEFQFEFKRPACNSGTPTVALQLQGGTLLEVDGPLDYALIMPALAGNDPQSMYGFLKWDVRTPNLEEKMYVPGHPSGDPKRLSVTSTHPQDQSGRCEVFSLDEPSCQGGGPPEVGYYCDTEGGSSGSPVLSAVSHEVIALHHCANCPNRGVAIEDVYADIQASAHPLPACSTCAPTAAPQNLTAVSPADNQINVDWQPVAGATEYRIFRSTTSCEAGMTQIATDSAPPYEDNTVSSGVVYFYVVRAVSACGALSAPSNCAQGSPGGECIAPPRFSGLTLAESARAGVCGVDLSWDPAAALCGAPRYNVYRSTFAPFSPGPGNRVAACLTTTSWHDARVLEGETYHYIVRAEDDSGVGPGSCAAGNVESNGTTRAATPRGPDQVFASWGFEPGQPKWPITGEWQVDTPRGLGGTASGGLGGPDPTTPFAGSYVLGHDLRGVGASAGNYENNIASDVIGSPSFSTVGRQLVFMRFARWLGVDRAPGDRATVQVYDGAAWNEAWDNPEDPVFDTAWTTMDLDVSAWIGNKPLARVGFTMQSNGSGNACGWNIDNVEVYSPTACTSTEPRLPAVPDGRFAPGTPMKAARGAGDDVSVTWDTSRCTSAQYALFHGDSAQLPSYGYTGALCAIGTSGQATVEIPAPAPGHATFWVVAGTSGTAEGPHGYTSAGSQRPAKGTGHCSIATQSSAAPCR